MVGRGWTFLHSKKHVEDLSFCSLKIGIANSVQKSAGLRQQGNKAIYVNMKEQPKHTLKMLSVERALVTPAQREGYTRVCETCASQTG